MQFTHRNGDFRDLARYLGSMFPCFRVPGDFLESSASRSGRGRRHRHQHQMCNFVKKFMVKSHLLRYTIKWADSASKRTTAEVRAALSEAGISHTSAI